MTKAAYDDSPYRPYTLWFETKSSYETLPSGNTAQVYLIPHPDSCSLVGHWNGQACRVEACGSLVEAERRAWEWHEGLYRPREAPEPRPEPQTERWFSAPAGLVWAG